MKIRDSRAWRISALKQTRSKEMARRIREAYVSKKRLEMDLGRLSIANSVTLAPRVKCDIMKLVVGH